MNYEDELGRFQEKYQIDHFVCLYSEDGVAQLAQIISSRVQLAQYELLIECDRSLSWEEYVYRLAVSEEMQARARNVVLEAQRDFSNFVFNEQNWRAKEQPRKEIISVQLFDGEAETGIVMLFAFRAELAHYRTRKGKNATYTLGQYMQDLWTDEALAIEQRRGFEQVVDSLDFKAAWKRIGYEFF